jgi:predicted nucleotide-binding protein
MLAELRQPLREFQDYLEDIQRSTHQTFGDALKRFLGPLAPDLPLGSLAARVLPAKRFDDWEQELRRHVGGMGGRGPLSWPQSTAERLALQLELLRRIESGTIDLFDFCLTFLGSDTRFDDMVRVFTAQIIRPFARDLIRLLHAQPEFAPDVPNPSVPQLGHTVPTLTSSRQVFVVHGHNEAARESVCRFLERLKLTPIVLHEQASRGRTIIEKFEAHSDVAFAVVALTADDVGASKENAARPRPRARQNVILELGYFVAKLGRDHVCALHEPGVELPSDFDGVVYVSLAGDAWRLPLAREIKAAGIEVDLNLAI